MAHIYYVSQSLFIVAARRFMMFHNAKYLTSKFLLLNSKLSYFEGKHYRVFPFIKTLQNVRAKLNVLILPKLFYYLKNEETEFFRWNMILIWKFLVQKQLSTISMGWDICKTKLCFWNRQLWIQIFFWNYPVIEG